MDPRAGLLNVAGTQVGVAIWLTIAVMGLGAAVHLMGDWFVALRYAGAAYLVWLGIKLLRSKGDLAVAADRARPGGSFFLQGFNRHHVESQDAGALRNADPALHFADRRLFEPALDPRPHLRGNRAGGRYLLRRLASGKAGQWLSRSRIRAIEIVSGICLTAGGVWLALRKQ